MPYATIMSSAESPSTTTFTTRVRFGDRVALTTPKSTVADVARYSATLREAAEAVTAVLGGGVSPAVR